MEKDHFKDRSIEGKIRNEVQIGDYAFICTKEMQPYASTLDDLELIRIKSIFTKHDHPRGIKCEGITERGEIKKGRIVYLLRNGKILRNI